MRYIFSCKWISFSPRFSTISVSDILPVFPSQEQFSEVLDAMFELRVQPQEHVIDQGDDGDNFYVIER